MSRFNLLLVSGLLFLMTFISNASNMLVAPLLKSIALSLDMEISAAGYLVTIYGLVAGFVALLTGPFSDRFGRKKIMVLFGFLSSASIILFAFSFNAVSLYIFRIINAAAVGPLFFCSLAYIRDYFPLEKRGTVTGIVTSSLFISVIAAVPVGLKIASTEGFTWRTAFVILGLLCLAATVAVLLILKHIHTGRENSSISIKPVLQSFRNFFGQKDTAGFLIMFLANYIAVGIFITYYPSYLMINRELSVDGLITVYSIGGIFAFASNLLAGRLTDRLNRRKTIVIANLLVLGVMAFIINFRTTADNIALIILLISIVYMSGEAFRTTFLQTEAISRTQPAVTGFFLGTISFLIAAGNSLGAAIGAGVQRFYRQYDYNLLVNTNEAISERNLPFLKGYELAVCIACAAVILSIWLTVKNLKK